MGTLWSELGPVAEAVADRPRVYADANVPSGVVAFMRGTLRWDVLCVMEHPDLQGLRRWNLATRDAHGLYRRFGFTALAAPERYMEKVQADIYAASRDAGGSRRGP